MTFPEIFDNFKNHHYIRRKSWSKHVFAQYRHAVPLIRLIWFTDDNIEDSCKSAVDTLSNDFKFTAEDLLADDWVNIDEL